MADPEGALAEPDALDDGDAGTLLPTALDEACKIAVTSVEGEGLASVVSVSVAAAVKGMLTDESPVPTNDAAVDGDTTLGVPHALGDSD